MAARKPLSVWLRERLEAADRVLGDLAALRNALLDNAASAGLAPPERAALIELLLLMRAVATPEKLRQVRSDMKRLGIDPWTPETENDD